LPSASLLAAAFLPGTYGWVNIGALLLILSNFLDHTDGELARISGKSKPHRPHLRPGQRYRRHHPPVSGDWNRGGDEGWEFAATAAGHAGTGSRFAVALIFYLRMRIEELAGKGASKQGSLAGFETEDDAVTCCRW